MNAQKITRDAVLAYMASPGFQPGKLKELARGMRIPQAAYRDFRRLVKELESEGLVVRLRHNLYAPPGGCPQMVGMLRVHPKGFGFVVGEGNQADVFVPKAELRQAIDGDQVRVEIISGAGEGKGPEGRIAEVVKETCRDFVGSFERRGRRWVVVVDDPAMGRDIYVDGGGKSELEEGMKVLVRITERGWGYDGLRGEIVEVLGFSTDPHLDFLTVVKRFDLPTEFPPAVKAEAELADLEVEDELRCRQDLRLLDCVTIDPVDARDFDDAVSLERVSGGGYHLGVHIADVSHFVQAGTGLDKEARNRSTSVYLLDRVIHMLPEGLAAGLCSLLPEEDRLAVSVLAELDEGGEVMGFEIVESVICSRGRLTYEEVQAVFDEKEEGMGKARDFADMLRTMLALSRKRRLIRRRRGSLDFDLPEPRVVLDDDGRPTALGRQPRLESQQLVEEFMLLANECVGGHAGEDRLPVLYRVHGAPDPEKLKLLTDMISPSKAKVGKTGRITPKELQVQLEQVQGRPDGALLHKLLLQAMMKAEYAPVDIGHFGLACRRYLHFTSPIRRYPDLLVHRILKAEMAGEMDGERRNILEEQLEQLGRWTSQCERRAEQAERIYVKTKQLRYMEEYVGELFPGLVSGILRGGFFVEVGDFAVDGFCFLRNLDDYFEFDERRHRLVGRRTRRVIQLGMEVKVQITGVDWAAQEMDLLLVGEDSTESRSKKKKKSKNKGKKKSKKKKKQRTKIRRKR